MVRRKITSEVDGWCSIAHHPWRIIDSCDFLNAAYGSMMGVCNLTRGKTDEHEIIEILYTQANSFIMPQLRMLDGYLDYELYDCIYDPYMRRLPCDTLYRFRLMSNVITSIIFEREIATLQISDTTEELSVEDPTEALGSWFCEKSLKRARRLRK
jgi:hypothetical protein